MTKIVKRGRVYPFITGDDVIITKNIQHANETVDEAIESVDDRLDKHEKDIDRLKSNLKYVYSYGGVGGRGGSGGSGGGSTGNPVLFISVGGHQLSGGDPIVFKGPGTYPLEISISNSGGETFFVTVGYGNTIDYPTEYKLSTELNKCKRSDTLQLNSNGEIVVNFYNSDYSPLATIRQRYIVNPHIFEMKFKYEFDNGSGNKQEAEFDSNNEYFIGDAVHTNPFIDASFKIDIPNITNISIDYSIGDTENGQGTETFVDTNITNNHFKIYLDELIRNGKQFTDESNTGTYTVSMSLNYYSNAELVTDTLLFKITLIPNYLYIYVRNPQDLMYDSLEDLINARNNGFNGIPEKHMNLGTYTSFYCKVYEGPIKSDRLPYTVDLKTYDNTYEEHDGTVDGYEFDDEHISNNESRPGVYEQVEMTPPFSITFGTPGVKKLVFSTMGKKDDIPDGDGCVVKYIFVKETESTFKWYPENLQQDTFYFRANSGNDSYSKINNTEIKTFPQLSSGTSPFEMSVTGDTITLSNEHWVPSSSDNDTTILSFGLQYSAVNSDSVEILRTYSGSSQNADIVLYSDKLFSDTGKKICIPTESNFNKSVNNQYHLVQIVRYKVGYNSGNYPQYATYLYIDGKLESDDPTIRENQLYIGRIVLNNVNIVYNLINIQYAKVLIPGIYSQNHTIENVTIDELIYQYYLAYKDIMHIGEVTDAERAIFSNMSNMRFDGVNTIVNQSFVQGVAPHMPIPTMMMEYSGDDYAKFLTDLFMGYPNGDTSFGQRSISLYWCDGKKPDITTSLDKITIPQITNEGATYTGTWMVELQGTSTMRNRIKNLSLILNTQNTTGDKILLMSPNYKKNDPTTFLPERVWVLKADIADSAHANNTAVGKFVNRTCTPFSLNNGVSLDADVKKYIKNTLEGFPVLMYFKVGEDVYYLGVYNFNMGRQSYYNLGYHTSEDMMDMIGNITTSGPFSYSVGSGEVINTLAIGEIQDNFAQFDFHQYQENVLFTGSNDNGRSTMFGKDSKITGANIGAAKTTLANFVKSVTRAGAYCFANIGKEPVPSSYGKDEHGNCYGDCVNRYNYNAETGLEEVPDPSWQFSYNGTEKVWVEKTPAEGGITFDGVKNNVDNLLQCISPTNSENEPQEYFLDFTSASEYYTIDMAFGLVDSILKNMNIKSWDGKKCFIAFYDMDCAFGENNAGGEDVTYLAATDFWKSSTDKGYVEQVKIHYDYWDESLGKGFDFSSSYLFAIVKYAKAILGSSHSLTNYPQQFWAKLRHPETGELKNANYFVDNYFSSGVGKVPAYLTSLNYQVKYLYKGTILDDDGNETGERYIANESAFNGTRLEKVKDWLNKRLHFLDVMFNVHGIGIPIGGGYSTPVPDILNELYSNSDIIVLSDVFSTPNAKSVIMGGTSLVNVYAPMNTPFVINRGGQNEIYLLCAGTGNPNPIIINATRSESLRFLGSKEFTNLSMVEPFLTSAQQIISNKLEEIKYGGMNITDTNVDFHIVSTSVKNIQFNIPSLRGRLNIDSSNDLNGQAIHTLNISNSGLQGSFSGLKNLKSLNISSVSNENGEISVSACPLVGEQCSISGTNSKLTTLKKLTLQGVSGRFDISNTNIETMDLEVSKDKVGEIFINGDDKLKNLTLTGFKTVVIRGCPKLEKLKITDIADSENNKVETIIIDIPEDNTSSTPIPGLTKFNSESNVNGRFDFTQYTKLNLLGLSGCKNVVVIKIPNHKVSIDTFRENENLEFIDTTGIDSCIELTKDSTFYKCPRYAMRQSWAVDISETYNGKNIYSTLKDDNDNYIIYQCNKKTKMCIKPVVDNVGCKSLANTFYKQNKNEVTNYPENNPYTNEWGQKVYNIGITMADAAWFINTVVEGKKLDDAHLDGNIIVDVQRTSEGTVFGSDCCANITSLQGCFAQQGSIYYGGEIGNTVPNLTKYTSLENISAMYLNTGVNLISSELLSLPDSKNNNLLENKLIWNDFVRTDKIYKDALKYISYRITELTSDYTIYDNGNFSVPIKSGDTEPDEYFDIVDLLCPKKDTNNNQIKFTRIGAINYFSINSEQWVDYTKLFEVCPNVEIISGFLNSVDLSRAKIDGILKHCTKLKSVIDSFNHSGDVEEDLKYKSIDLYEFFNWDGTGSESNLFNIGELFSSNSLAKDSPGFAIKKHISQENFEKIMGTLNNYKTITKLSNIFSYCTIDDYDPNYEIKLTGDVDENPELIMDKITNMNFLFYKCKSGNNNPLKIRRSFFKHFPNVKTLIHTFDSVEFDHMLTYDFFCKRTSDVQNVYVKINDVIPTSAPNAQLHTYKYTKDQNNLYGCFMNAKFRNCKTWFDIADDNVSLKQPTDTITDINGNNFEFNVNTYYKPDGYDYVEYKISEPIAYTDTLNNFTNYVEQIDVIGSSSSTERTVIVNHRIFGDDESDFSRYGTNKSGIGMPYNINNFNIYPAYCCLPPDILYACDYNCDLQYVFANTNIIGTLPQHLLGNRKDSKLNNIFRNVNILPNVIYHCDKRLAGNSDFLGIINNIPIDNDTVNPQGETQYTLIGNGDNDAIVLFRNSDGELRRRCPINGVDYNKSQFAYVPIGFTTNRDLKNAFTFRYNLPRQNNLSSQAIYDETGNVWASNEGGYGEEYNPDNMPQVWPYYTQYFFTTEESVDWRSVYDIGGLFISDTMDVDFVSGQTRVLSTGSDDDKNRWFKEVGNISKSDWNNKMGPYLNVFLNICGARNTRTGVYTDCGVPINKSIDANNYPNMERFISGILVVFLNGRVFGDAVDGIRLTSQNGSNIISYDIGFGRNIKLPLLGTPSNPSLVQKVLLSFPTSTQTTLFYNFMFINNGIALTNYKTYYGIKNEHIIEQPKFKVLP